MNTRRVKLAGLIALSLIMIVSFSACDNGIGDEDVTVESLGTLESMTVDYGYEGSDVLEELREERDEVDLNLGDGTTATGDVAWDKVPDDFDGTAEGDSFEFEGDVTYDGTVLNETVTVEVIIAEEDFEEDNAFFEVSINEEDSDSEGEPGETISIHVDVENSGNIEDTQEIKIYDENEETISSKNVTLESGKFKNIEFSETIPAGAEPGEVKLTVASYDDIDSYILTILGEEGNLKRIAKNPDEGFYWDYFLYIPETLEADSIEDYTNYLLVEPNNTGTTSDDYNEHVESARRRAEGNYIATELGVPVLVPTFPRPGSLEEAELEGWAYYTHALDRNTLKLDVEEYERIDKQLLAMIDHAQKILLENEIDLKDQVFMMGYSASGSFTNRFITLHPDRVEAIAAGGINGLPILPYETIDDLDLTYPVGVNDLSELTGISFNLTSYKNIPQFLYLGEEDANDTLPYDDAYDQPERELTLEVFDTELVLEDKTENAHIIVDRFEKAEVYYNELNIPAQFKIYENTGHSITYEKFNDVIEFFKNNAGNDLNEI